MYLAANIQADLACALHQTARFRHWPMHSHSLAIKCIQAYFKNIKNMGIILCPNGDFKLWCYVDSDFGGLFESENPEYTISVKSNTRYLI